MTRRDPAGIFEKGADIMTIAERNRNALVYIEKCERRRQRRIRRRQRRLSRFMQTVTPFAGGICVLAAVMALV